MSVNSYLGVTTKTPSKKDILWFDTIVIPSLEESMKFRSTSDNAILGYLVNQNIVASSLEVERGVPRATQETQETIEAFEEALDLVMQAGLVVLMSYYPGWKLLIDGKPAQVTPYNGYLGSKMFPGNHSYIFYFLPTQYIFGTTISVIALILIIAITLSSPLRSAMQRIRQTRIPSTQPDPAL